VSLLLIVPETSLMLAPGTDRVSLVTTFDNDLSVSRGIKPADAQSFISVDYLWAGMSSDYASLHSQPQFPVAQ
jgi:hypothetical protein